MRSALLAARRVLHGFLPPYCAGGDVSVASPLRHEEVVALSRAIEQGEGPDDVAVARHLHAAEVAPVQGVLSLRRSEAVAIATIYNLLSLSDPEPRSFVLRSGELERARDYTLTTASMLPAPREPVEALAAHSLVAPIQDASRTDTIVRFWAGRVRYRGRAAPSIVLRFPRVRRVRLETVERVLLDADKDPLAASVLEELLRYSPLTNLLTIGRSSPHFTLEGLADCMSDSSLCRGVIRSWASRADVAAVGGALARAIMEHLRQPRDKAEISLWLHVFYHLRVAAIQGEMLEGHDRPAPGRFGCSADTEDERWHLALFKVLHRGGETFGIPGAAVLGEELAGRVGDFDVAAKTFDTSEEEREIVGALTSFFNMVGFPGWPRRRPD